MNFIRKSQLKKLALIAIISFGYLAVNAQPGVLDMILRNADNSNTQIVTSNNYGDEIISVQVVNEIENSTVYEAKVFINASSKTRLNCNLPKGSYKVIFTSLKQQTKTAMFKIMLD